MSAATTVQTQRSRRRRLPRVPRPVLITFLVVLAYAIPLIRPPFITTLQTDFASVMFDSALMGLVAVGLNIVIGYAGLLDLGYVGFYACGAYTVGVLTSYHWHWPFLLVLPVAVAFTMLTGVLLGAPTLRVRGDYLAIVTMGFGEIIRQTVNNTPWLGGPAGIKNIPAPPSIGPNPDGPDGGLFTIPHISWNGLQPLIDLGHQTHFLKFGVLDAVPYYWVALTALFIVLLLDHRLLDSRIGRAWEATREDEDAAELMGVRTFKYKLMAFAFGASIGGLSGTLYATREGGYINPQTFVIQLSMLFVAAVIVGGAGNRWGALAGGVVVAFLPERFRQFSDWRLLVFGVALMALAIWRPQGLLPPKRAKRAKKVEEEIEMLEEGGDGDHPDGEPGGLPLRAGGVQDDE
ncbi:branched-chain amino acid ABC transporter permease [Nocardioides ultimimeridianus]